MAKRRKRTEKQKPELEKQKRNLKQLAIAINNLDISVRALRNTLINKDVATEEELNNEWDKIWKMYK